MKKPKKLINALCLMIILSFLVSGLQSFGLPKGFDRILDTKKDKDKKDTSGGLTEEIIRQGLKEALSVGIRNAIAKVSKVDGYYRNADIKIDIPPDMKPFTDKMSASSSKYRRMTEELVLAMNRTAEGAAPEAEDIFIRAIDKLTLKEAIAILKGDDDATTRFFETNTRSELYATFFPIVQKHLDRLSVKKQYETLFSIIIRVYTGKKATDINQYVTNKALDGLFFALAQEEYRIRRVPAARITALLGKVFGSLDK